MSRSVRQLERRVETAEKRARHQKQAEITERFRRLTVREIAIIAAYFPRSDARVLTTEERHVLASFQSLVDEAKTVFEQPEIIKLLTETIANNRPHVQAELRRMKGEPWV